jgi:hypothetical protein
MEYNKAAEAEKEDGTHYIGRKLVSLLLLLLVATEYSAEGNIDSLMRFHGGFRIFFYFYCLVVLTGFCHSLFNGHSSSFFSPLFSTFSAHLPAGLPVPATWSFSSVYLIHSV